jgi:hypothetical protein
LPNLVQVVRIPDANPFPQKLFYCSHRLNPVMIYLPGI